MKIKQITNPDNNMWRSADPPQRTERVAARIGGGGLKVIDQEHGLSDKSGSVFKQSLRQINDRILENNDIECIANGLSSNDKLTIDMNEVPERLQAELITDYDEFRQMIADAQSIHHNEPDVYFYHSDHLGSASWITDNGGLAVQHLQYLPYGERYVDQRISGYSERFTFTCKERDEETGYGYFGARYMDHELMTMWLSVDPMADKYPSISPYAYCAWNPVKLVDPNGREIDDYFSKSGKYLGSDNATTNNVRIMSEDIWNGLQKDPMGRIDKNVGYVLSTDFATASQKEMSEESQLLVYQHYNPTEYKVEAAPSHEKKSKYSGMITKIGCEDKKTDKAYVTHLYIKLEENRTPNSHGESLCDNADEIVNSFVHERDHIIRGLKMGYSMWAQMNSTKEGKKNIEKSAILSQRNHQSWNGCRMGFKIGVDNYEKKF